MIETLIEILCGRLSKTILLFLIMVEFNSCSTDHNKSVNITDIDPVLLSGTDLLKKCDFDITFCNGIVAGSIISIIQYDFYHFPKIENVQSICIPTNVSFQSVIDYTIDSIKGSVDINRLNLEKSIRASLIRKYGCTLTRSD
jgi:hypothetical protein